MDYSISTLRVKAHQAGYSFQRGYQRYLHKGWGYCRDLNGNRIIGYQIFDYLSGFYVWPSYNDVHDHALSEDEAVSLLQELCEERNVKF